LPNGTYSVRFFKLMVQRRGNSYHCFMTSRLKTGFFAILIVLGVCAGIYLFMRPAPALPSPEREISSIIVSNDITYAKGSALPYTGMLLDRYAYGLLKSKSMLSNGLLEGLSKGWYTNGQLQVTESFSKGMSEGTRLKYYPNGARMSEALVVHGRLQGVYKKWNEDGVLMERMEMKDGVPEGVSREWFPTGFLKVEATISDGKVVSRRDYKDGETRGPESLRN
jgi:antitoxin component YwqK of YwqJK toxin-antitoxin module